MRHRKKGRKLNRTASHRKALLRNLANQLFEHKEIKTTTAKAKEARSTVERLITYAKKGDLHHRRLAFRFLRNKESIKILFDELAPAFSEREGGYTRLLKLGNRQGDAASISMLQLVGFEKLSDTSKPEKKKKTKKKETTPQLESAEKAVVGGQEVPDVQEADVVEEAIPEEQPAMEEKETAPESETPELAAAEEDKAEVVEESITEEDVKKEEAKEVTAEEPPKEEEEKSDENPPEEKDKK